MRDSHRHRRPAGSLAPPLVGFAFVVSFLVFFLLPAAGSWAAQAAPVPAAASRPTIVFMTDFGTDNDAVPICKGVIYGLAPEVRIIDLTHQITPYSILDGARYLAGTTPYYPAGTIFEAVVDPGVGSARKAIVVKSRRDQYLVLPDNGLLTQVQDRDGLEGAREITNPGWMIGQKLSSTFHGRDIFSPAAAHLARGDNWSQAGPEVPLDKLVRLNIPKARLDEQGISGLILALDRPFGSLISNIQGEDFLKLGYTRGDQVPVELDARRFVVAFVKTFSDVPVGKPLLYIDSRGQVGLAINQGSFSASNHVTPPVAILIPRKSE